MVMLHGGFVTSSNLFKRFCGVLPVVGVVLWVLWISLGLVWVCLEFGLILDAGSVLGY